LYRLWQILHYTSIDVLKIMFNKRTLKCNSLKNVNDQLERKRNGIENLTDTFYVSCFCHYQYEVVPFWFMYGGNSPDERKVFLRFKNFAKDFNNAIEDDWAITGDNKIIYFDHKNLFSVNTDEYSCCPINASDIENRQIIDEVRMFNVEYLPPDNEVFLKNYKTQGTISFGERQDLFPTAISDARSVGKQKTIHWKYEEETRIQCRLSPMDVFYFEYILLRLKEEVFRDMIIVVNPWTTDEFISEVKAILKKSNLPEKIINSISVNKSELDGQIVRRKL